tara:strand:+ start:739 stop:1068 length:330 start_codon:yes stop_codon:yes gene_type:complete
MRTGQFRYRIGIYSMVPTKNGFGENELLKTLFKSLRASRKYIGGTLTEQDNAVSTKRTLEFSVRFDEDIQEDMVIEYKGDDYICKYVFHTYEQLTTMRCVHSGNDRNKN